MSNPRYNFEVYRSKRQFYWRIRAKNGRIVGDSSEGYHRKSACMRFIHNLKSIILDGRIESIKIKDLTL